MIQPGDLVQWRNKDDGYAAHSDTLLFSSVEKRWVQIGSSPAILLRVEGNVMTFLNASGLFCISDADDIAESPAPGDPSISETVFMSPCKV